MGIYWLGDNPPRLGIEITQIHRTQGIDETGLLFIQGTVPRRWRNSRRHRVYLVTDTNPAGPLSEGIAAVIPNNPAVIEAIAALYTEMQESFDLGDELIRSVNEKDLAIEEKQKTRLRDSRRHRAIIRHATDLIFVLGPKGRILFCNETLEQYIGGGHKPLVGMSFIDAVSMHDRKHVSQMLHRSFHKGVPSRCEVKLEHSCGRIGVFSLMSTPLREEGRIYALSVIGRDITDLRTLQHRLSIQANDLTQMIKGISHELRNPLTVIGAYIHRLERGHMDVDEIKRKEALSGIYTSIRRIEEMIERIERYEALVTMEEIRAEVSLGRLVSETISSFDGRVPIHLTISGDITAYTDETHVRLALTRIMENAVETGTTKIDVDLSQEKGCALIAVRDFGPGVRHGVETIFAPFFSTDPMKTGLGLTEARIAMAKIGGQIEVVAQADPGAIFTLKILQDRRIKARPKEKTLQKAVYSA
ncbi:MAG TPA: PAS domain-containing sensor histidine kinase [Deltaproteobacteria bacterium]|nr:PAS domain-containing sensor histidine kinase [Deltaproteobacteria bacterium]